MDRIVEVINSPKKNRYDSYPSHSLFIVKIHKITSECEGDYEAHLSPEEYELRCIKEKLYFEYNIPEEIIERMIGLSKQIAIEYYDTYSSEDI